MHSITSLLIASSLSLIAAHNVTRLLPATNLVRTRGQIPYSEYKLYHVNGWDAKRNQLTEVEVDPRTRTANIPRFDANEYSLFKYGHVASTMKYAKLMATMFMRNFPEYFNPALENRLPELVITGSAYKNMPVAATHLTNAFFGFVNEERLRRRMEPFQTTKIYRHVLISQDYSQMDPRAREAAMARNKLGFDWDTLRGKHLVVLDDCIITGGHRNKIQAATSRSGIRQITYLYIASVLRGGQDTTAAEDYMNHLWVSRLHQWWRVISQPDALEITARAMKYFMNSKRPKSELQFYAGRIPCKVVYEMYFGCINDGLTEAYADAFRLIHNQWRTRCRQVLRTPGSTSTIRV